MSPEIISILNFLLDTPLAALVSENEVLFPWIESLHVLGIALVFGSIVVVDLRLLGLIMRDQAIHAFLRQYLIITWLAFALSAITGAVLFVSNAMSYASNTNFQIKLILLICAGLNMVIFQNVFAKEIPRWLFEEQVPRVAKIMACISICIWLGVVIFGRLIGFTLIPTIAN